MADIAQEIWNRAKERLAEELPPPAFASWFSGISAKGLDGELLILEAPSGYVKGGWSANTAP
jgi:chromosomal replication initiation ATPase DnaA